MKSAFVFAVFLSLIVRPAYAQTPDPQGTFIEVWPQDKMPGKGAKDPEMVKPAKDPYHRVTNVSQPTLTFFPAPKKDGPSPAMIVCPGGGYSYVVVDKEGSEIATWLNSIGVSAFVLKYRVPNNREGAFQDAQRALSLTRANAAKWNIDPKRVGIIGFSAGGNLAAKAATLSDTRAYPAIDAADQQSCRPDFAMLVYPAYLDDKGRGIPSEAILKSDVPPCLIVHNEDDKSFVAGSKFFNATLDEAKKPHQFLLYQTGGHGYALHCDLEAKAWPQAASEWLQKNGFR